MRWCTCFYPVKRRRRLLLASLVFLSLTGCYVYYDYGRTVPVPDSYKVSQEWASDEVHLLPRLEARNFTGFDNRLPNSEPGEYLVPNIVHYIRFNSPNFSFTEVVCFKTAYYNITPDYFYIHTDNAELGGYYWDKLKEIPDLFRRIKILPVTLPRTIFGKPFSKNYHYWHASDVTRIKILMKYGGIYLDNDVYVVQNLQKYRRYEMVLGWEANYLGTQVLFAHRDARFLRRWLQCYKDYRGRRWIYNASEKPSYEVVLKEPEIVHVVYKLFAANWFQLIFQLYQQNWTGWRNQETIHLTVNHRRDFQNFLSFSKFDENNIRRFPYTYREMALEVYERRDTATLGTSDAV